MTARFQIAFEHEFHYRAIPGLRGVHAAVPVGLIGPAGRDDALALIDTGASYSLFNGRRARAIGLDLAQGRTLKLSGLTGVLQARLLRVALEILGNSFDCEVAFSEQDIHRELLGRNDLFAHIRLGFLEGSSLGYFHPSP